MAADLVTTWANRELPILREALRRLDAGAFWADTERIREELAFDAPQMRAGLKALEDASPPYIGVDYLMGGGPNRVAGRITSVSERARRELGTWPTPESLVDRLAAALAEAADAEQEPQRKGRLRAGAEALVGFGRDIAVGVIANQVGG
jgi:hypothetical protein